MANAHNLLLFPSTPSNGVWTQTSSCGVTDNVGPDPDGGNNAFQLNDPTGAAVSAQLQDVIAAGLATYCLSAKIKKSGGSGKGIALDLRCTAFASPSKLGAVIINDVTGGITPRVGFVPDVGYACVSYATGWWIAYLAMAIDNTNLFAAFEPAFNSDFSGNPDVASIGNAVMWDAALEVGSVPSDLSRGTGFFSLL